MAAEIRKLGGFDSSAIGLGCMNLSHAYGTPPAKEDAAKVLTSALDLGYTHFDTAALYGFGANETLVGEVLKPHRDEIVLASKCGLFKNEEGKREINGRPEVIKKTCEDALKRLQTEVIDLYYLHRWDRNIPIEESIGAMAELIAEGKIRSIGLSEVSAKTLRKAHQEHPIAAVQTEYSLWTRNPEIAVLDACRELGTTFVAFSPLGRGFLPGNLRDVSLLEGADLRRNMPRFRSANYDKNLMLLDGVSTVAKNEGLTMSQLALVWLLTKGDHIIPIPGTTSLSHLEENYGAVNASLSVDAHSRLDRLVNQSTVTGARYNVSTQAEIDTEEFE